MKYQITKIYHGLVLGEGCIWDEKRNSIHFVDILERKIYTYNLDNEKISYIDTEDYVGCIVLNKDNSMIAAIRNTLVKINLETGSKEVLLTINQPNDMRFNDGKCDKFGNLWVGTMNLNPFESSHYNCGKLYCIKNNIIIAEYEKFNIPNGLAWDKSGETFYHIDSMSKEISSYSVLDEGVIEKRSVLVRLDEMDQLPDGMCIDTNGILWVSIWGGSKVCGFDSKNGSKVNELIIEDTNISCCAFGGLEMKDLYITSAQDKDGNLGGLFVAKLNGVKGGDVFTYGEIRGEK